MGGGVQTQDSDSNPLLDRGPPQRTLAMVRQGDYQMFLLMETEQRKICYLGSNANGVTLTEMWIEQLTC